MLVLDKGMGGVGHHTKEDVDLKQALQQDYMLRRLYVMW